MAYLRYKNVRGISLIEVLVVAAVMLIVFGGLFSGFRYSLDLISQSRAKLSALTLANDRMEYIRSLSYDAVGTISGIPPGLIPQLSTTSLNNILFTESVLVEYIDDDGDGLSGADSNGITTDYKQAKVTLSWETRGVPHEIFLVSNIIPRSIETNVGGGTLRVNVFDADVVPLPGAQVRVTNTSATTTIDVTRTTDATGVALFGGAPAGPNYEISVTAPGYSTDKTYIATTSLPNPTTQPIAVLEADISTMNFFIDRLSSLVITTLSDKVEAEVVELFGGMTGIATSTNISVAGGHLELTQSAGIYNSPGVAYLEAVTPPVLAEWGSILIDATTPAQTTVTAQLYIGTSTDTLIPDSALPGNSSGFSGNNIDISGLDPVSYPSFTLGLTLNTTNIMVTPQIDQIRTQFFTLKTLAPAIALTVTGAKTVGTLANTSPVYKTVLSTSTSGNGVRTLAAIEWDLYTVTPVAYDVAEACSNNPVVVAPGASSTLEVVIVPNTAHSLRVSVVDSAGMPLRDAVIDLNVGGFADSRVTASCGQGFFSGLTPAGDYTLAVSLNGYPTQTFTPFVISGDVVQVVTF
jgi:type II secretory pathway pseudopilin PulG